MQAALVQSKTFAYVGPSDWTVPAPGITIPVTYPAAEMTYVMAHINYITFSLTYGLRTVYLKNLKNLICVYIVKCQVKFCLLLDFLHIILFLTNLASTSRSHEISRRAACSPRVGLHCSKASDISRITD